MPSYRVVVPTLGLLGTLAALACSSIDPGAYTQGRARPDGGAFDAEAPAPAASTDVPDAGLGVTPPVTEPDASSPAADAGIDAPAAVACIACINAGGAAYTSPTGRVYSADTGANAGDVYVSPNPIVNSADAPVYQSERYGQTFTYSIPVPNGSYRLNLLFAEVYWTAAGQRVFNVDVQGQRVLENFDIFQGAGAANTAITKTYPVTVTAGTVEIAFTTVTDAAKISGIEILPATAP